MKFDWDPSKEKKTIIQRGISFDEAKSVFYDENARELYDDEHSEHEDRFAIVGMSIKIRELVVCYCMRHGDIYRIISARRATKSEKDEYYGRR